MDNFCQRSQAVGGARCVGNDGLASVFLVVHAHDEHRGVVFGRSGHHDAFCACFEVSLSKFLGQEETSGFHHIVSAHFVPFQVCGILFSGNANLVAVHHQHAVFHGNLALEFAMHGVITKHVSHVIHVQKVIDSNHLHVVSFCCSSENQSADTAKTVNTNFNFFHKDIFNLEMFKNRAKIQNNITQILYFCEIFFRPMFSLYIKELKSFLSSIIGYIFIGVFLIVSGLFIWVFPNVNNVLESGLADLQGLFNLSQFLFLFLVPAITMRSFAEEKRTGTMDFLLTLPLTDMQIVWAKFLACFTLLVISLLPTLVYVITVYWIGNPVGNIDMGSTWGSYLGLLFLGASFIAIGLFSSSLTNNQIVAFIIAALLCFILSFGFAFIYSFDALGNFGYYLKTLGIEHHYSSISQGVVDTRDVIYFCSVVFIFLYSTRLVLLSRKW